MELFFFTMSVKFTNVQNSMFYRCNFGRGCHLPHFTNLIISSRASLLMWFFVWLPTTVTISYDPMYTKKDCIMRSKICIVHTSISFNNIIILVSYPLINIYSSKPHCLMSSEKVSQLCSRLNFKKDRTVSLLIFSDLFVTWWNVQWFCTNRLTDVFPVQPLLTCLL